MGDIDRIIKLRLYTQWVNGDPDQLTDDQMCEMIDLAERAPIFDGRVSPGLYERTCDFLDALDTICTYHKQGRFSLAQHIIIEQGDDF